MIFVRCVAVQMCIAVAASRGIGAQHVCTHAPCARPTQQSTYATTQRTPNWILMICNKTMDYDDLFDVEAQTVVRELHDLVLLLREKNLHVSSWYGSFDLSGDPLSFEVINRGFGYTPLPDAVDDKNFPWFLYWQIMWVARHARFAAGQRVLDLGGSSSLFSCYLAHKGCKVTTVDRNSDLVENADRVAAIMGWHMTNQCMDIRNLDVGGRFEHITSICVFEHIPMFDRVGITAHIKRFLKSRGRFSLTFDYRNPVAWAKISRREDVEQQFIAPSGLTVRGNRAFFDNSKNDLLYPFFSPHATPEFKRQCVAQQEVDASLESCVKSVNEYTFGALFLENV